ncbi:MAG: single-stranded DNA-binding protein [Cyanobacteria bacterium J06632_19]
MSNIFKVRQLPRSFVVNNMMINGRLGGNPERKEFDSGTVKYKCSAAFGKDKEGNTMWIACEAWANMGSYGEKGVGSIIGRYVGKGQMMEAVGQLQIQNWNDRNTGERRAAAVLKVINVRLVESKAKQEQTSPINQQAVSQIKEKF